MNNSRVADGQQVERKLAAILAADVVGYSRLMGVDETGTIAQLKALRNELMAPCIARHRGRTIKLMGDGTLVEFASVVEAVECAVEIQQATTARQTGIAEEKQLAFRIGINLGDVIIDGGEVYGDGVNIAARLETLAESGGLCISGMVHDQIRDKLPYAFEDRGEQTVKNITRPVHIYALSTASIIALPPAGDAARPADLLPIPEAQTGPHLQAMRADKSEQALGEGSTPPALPDMPSIAVLPFTNMSGAPEQSYFADGITEDIITGLSRLRWLFVIARNSSFAYKDRSVDVRQIARELGVRYILEGSVRAAGGRIRVVGQLIDAGTGKHIWAEKYDRDIADIFAVQDEITDHVVAAIEPHLYEEEGVRVSGKPPGSIDAWGLVVRAMGLISKVGRRQNEEAQDLLRQAIAMEPSYARAHALLSWAVWWASLCYWVPDSREAYRQAAQHAEDAVSHDRGDPWAKMTFGLCLSTAGQHDRALVELQSALNLNPSFALGRTAYGWALLRAGRYDEAIAETGKAVRLSPTDSFAGIYTAIHGLALLGARHFEEALPHLRASVTAFAEYSGHYNTLISCCGHLGLIDEAQEFIAARSRVGPPLHLSVLRQNLGRFAHCEVFVEGMRKAGVPE